MPAPKSMLDHVLNALKGWPSQAALDYTVAFDPAVPAILDPVPAGRCCHLSPTSGLLVLGCPKVAGKLPMPLFTYWNSDDPDVQNPGGVTGNASTDSPDGWMAAKRANMLCLVATGGYELETTEYITDTYAPGDPLKADTADKGVIRKGTTGDLVVGTVSRGVKNTGQLGTRKALAFWPVLISNLS
jgi:hypothetical protein